jgi:hypothetical protein
MAYTSCYLIYDDVTAAMDPASEPLLNGHPARKCAQLAYIWDRKTSFYFMDRSASPNSLKPIPIASADVKDLLRALGLAKNMGHDNAVLLSTEKLAHIKKYTRHFAYNMQYLTDIPYPLPQQLAAFELLPSGNFKPQRIFMMGVDRILNQYGEQAVP